jgi:hypothetical protein
MRRPPPHTTIGQLRSLQQLDAPAKALRAAKWARIMTKWLVSHASKGGAKWQVVSFNGKSGQESKGIVDMIAIRKNHSASVVSKHRGDLFEIVLLQVKGGSAKFPSKEDVKRLIRVKEHHRADKVVLTEWKQGEKLCCYVLPDTTQPVPASDIFGKVPSKQRVRAETEVANSAT